jgi:hypothetical protein
MNVSPARGLSEMKVDAGIEWRDYGKDWMFVQ